MRRLTLEIPDELAERLKPYRDELLQILQLGLGQIEKTHVAVTDSPRARAIEALQKDGLARPLDQQIAQRYVPELDRHVHAAPVEAGGQPASEWIIEHRGTR